MRHKHMKQAKDYITRLKREIPELLPSRETLKKLAREPEFPQTGQELIDPATGEIVDYATLQPYMERAGYNINLAMTLYLESYNGDV